LDEAIKQTGVALPQQIPPQTRVPYSLYTVRFRDYKRRNCVQDRLKSMGFGVKLPFIPLHLMPALKAHPQVKVRFNLLNACELYDKGLVLPCNSLMERKHIDQIADTIKKYG
jgi:dTDP-4-amino-4,6-dideoxygalactose transaminase